MIRPGFVVPLVALVSLLAPGAASAAPEPPAAPLAGPRVDEDATEGIEGMAAGGGGARARPATERRNMELWRRTFEELLPDLAPDVQARVRDARAAFEARTKAWRESNGEKIAALERKARERMQGDGEGEKPDGSMLRQVRELRATAPKVEDLQQAIWALLAPEQQERFRKRYDELKQEADRRAAQRKGQGQAQPKAPADPMQADPSLPGGGTPERHPVGKPFNFQDAPRQPGRPSGGKPATP